jgi:hypothetical protein
MRSQLSQAGPANSQHEPPKRGTLARALAALGLTGALVAGLVAGVAVRRLTDPRVEPDPRPVQQPVLGVYRGGFNVAGVATFARWLGGPVDVQLDFLPADDWSTIEGKGWQLRPLAEAGHTVVLTVPLLPGPWERTGEGGVSLEACAAGDYDRHWTALGRNLVAHDLGRVVLRPGHEFNGGWYAWRAGGDEDAFAGCFRRLVAATRAVAGAGFTYVWNPAIGGEDADAVKAWPGDDVVDYVGIDVYDQSWLPGTYPLPEGASAGELAQRRARAWAGLRDGPLGLTFWDRFARSHGKPLVIPEWGLTRRSDGHGGGDNPAFVQRMREFIADPGHRVAWHIYFEYDARDGEHALTGTEFASAARTFKAGFGGASTTGATPEVAP